MFQRKTEYQAEYPERVSGPPEKTGAAVFPPPALLGADSPSLIHFSSTPLFRLEKNPETYAHLLKKKDTDNVVPIINYFIGNSGHALYLAGDAVKNLYLHGKRKKYKMLHMLAILTDADADRYASIMNCIISANDGAFSLGLRYRVRKNRCDGCFREIAHARYAIEPRLVGPEKLLYPFRPSTIELDLTTRDRFSRAFGIEVR